MIHHKKISIAFALIIGLTLIYHFSPYKIEHWGERHKVWAYRVNAMENLDFIQNHYQGLEIDIMFDDERQALLINHPDVDCPPLDLELFLKNLDNTKIDGVWFDLKNLTIKNASEFSNLLEKVTQDFQFKKIVESKDIEALQYFKDKNFKISYYLPWSFKKDSKTLVSTTRLIKNNLEKFEMDFLSADMKNYHLAKQHFPDQDFLFWSTKGTLHLGYFKDSWNRRMILNDPKVKILLVKVDFYFSC